jgi:hypothetical protein
MAELPQSLRQVTFTVQVLDQINFATADSSSFAVARGDLVRSIQVDDVFAAGSLDANRKTNRLELCEISPRSRETSLRLSRLDQFP